MEYITLNNGIKMPQVGLGTFLIPKDHLENTLIKAYELGYRQFDTAWRYHNENDIANVFKKHGIKREDVFITTKINADALFKGGYKMGYHEIFNRKSLTIEQAVEESFENLQTEYIDLFLIHHPWRMFLEMWKVLERFYKKGRIKAIGVSSFLKPHLEAIAEISDVVPVVNQFEISPLNTQKELIRYCQSKGIAVEAMSTFSHYRSVAPRPEIIENEDLKQIAQKHGKSVVQIVLKWLLQQNIIIIPKTWNEQHLVENISLFDYMLTDSEVAKIDSLDRGKFLNYNPYYAQKGLPKHLRRWPEFRNPFNFSESFNSLPAWRKWGRIY